MIHWNFFPDIIGLYIGQSEEMHLQTKAETVFKGQQTAAPRKMHLQHKQFHEKAALW